MTKQYTFGFALCDSYVDKVTCDVVLLDICQDILGIQYLWDRDAFLYIRKIKLTFMKEGNKFVIRSLPVSQLKERGW